jgi:hypothetical protein
MIFDKVGQLLAVPRVGIPQKPGESPPSSRLSIDPTVFCRTRNRSFSQPNPRTPPPKTRIPESPPSLRGSPHSRTRRHFLHTPTHSIPFPRNSRTPRTPRDAPITARIQLY